MRRKNYVPRSLSDKTSMAGASRTTEREYDIDNTEPVIAVVEAVSAHEDTAPDELDETLYDAVDADALNTLLRSAPDASVTFTFNGYRVDVSTNHVTVAVPVDA